MQNSSTIRNRPTNRLLPTATVITFVVGVATALQGKPLKMHLLTTSHAAMGGAPVWGVVDTDEEITKQEELMVG